MIRLIDTQFIINLKSPNVPLGTCDKLNLVETGSSIKEKDDDDDRMHCYKGGSRRANGACFSPFPNK